MMRVLLVDDDKPCRDATEMLLRFLGYTVEAVEDAEQALLVFDPSRHRVVVSDHLMPGMTGVDLAAELKHRSSSTPIVICSAWGGLDRTNADALLPKPASLNEFRSALDTLLRVDSPRG
jgi:DNA-binding NtrC family response regulator